MTGSFFHSWAVACLRAPYDPAAAAQARACLSGPVFDWPGFVSFLHTERISPLIHYYLGGWDLFPPESAAVLQRDFLNTAWINSQRREELEKVLDHLAEANIQVTLLKGVALLYTIYEKSALRPMWDMDLLVRADDLEKAQQILINCGYSIALPALLPEALDSEIGFKKPDPFISLDLHYSLFASPHRLSTSQMEWFLDRRTTVQKGGQEVWTFSAEAQLLHLSAHLWLHHGGGDLLGWNDIYQVIRQNQERINWEEVLEAGQAFDLLLPLQNVLPELAANWQSPIPPEILARLGQMTPSRRETRKFGRTWRENQNYADTLMSGAMSYPDWPSRLRYLWMMVFPRAEFIRVRYQVRSPLLLPYFYAYRLVSRAFQQLGRAIHSRAAIRQEEGEK